MKIFKMTAFLKIVIVFIVGTSLLIWFHNKSPTIFQAHFNALYLDTVNKQTIHDELHFEHVQVC